MNSRPSRRAFLSLGANLGDRVANLRGARAALAGDPAIAIVAASPLYETAPQGSADQPSFLNQVVCIDTSLVPHDLLTRCQAIEDAFGRRRTRRFGPRTLDVDILLYEGVESDEPELTLPHPRLWRRAFVLVPLADVWEHARSMPAADVAALATNLVRTQAVVLYPAAED